VRTSSFTPGTTQVQSLCFGCFFPSLLVAGTLHQFSKLAAFFCHFPHHPARLILLFFQLDALRFRSHSPQIAMCRVIYQTLGIGPVFLFPFSPDPTPCPTVPAVVSATISPPVGCWRLFFHLVVFPFVEPPTPLARAPAFRLRRVHTALFRFFRGEGLCFFSNGPPPSFCFSPVPSRLYPFWLQSFPTVSHPHCTGALLLLPGVCNHIHFFF